MGMILLSAKKLNLGTKLNIRGQKGFIALLRKPLGSFFMRSTVRTKGI